MNKIVLIIGVCLQLGAVYGYSAMVLDPFVFKQYDEESHLPYDGEHLYYLGLKDLFWGSTSEPFEYLLTTFSSQSLDEWSMEIQQEYGHVGMYYRVAEMEKDELIDLDTFWSQPAFSSNFGEDYDHFVNACLTFGESFYFGVQLWGGYQGTPLFGWVELLWDDEGLRMTSSAMEITGLGIYCGEFRAIPEPATMSLFLLGAGSLFWRRRRRD